MKSIKRDCIEGIYRDGHGAITRIIVGKYRKGVIFCIPKFKTGIQIDQNCTVDSITNILKKTVLGSHTKNIEGIAKKTIEIINELSDLTSNEDPAKNIIKNPSTVKQMAEQIIVAADAYFSLRLEEDEFQELILNYASRHGKKLFGKNGKINPTIRNIIGKKRRELVELMLRGYQLSVF